MHNISNSYKREQINMRMQDWSLFMGEESSHLGIWQVGEHNPTTSESFICSLHETDTAALWAKKKVGLCDKVQAKLTIELYKMGHFYSQRLQGLFIYYVSVNNQWSLFKKMTKEDREGLRVIRKDDVWWKIQRFKGILPKTPYCQRPQKRMTTYI